MALRDIKQQIQSVNKTAKVTKAMESVSAVKMRKAQEYALSGREYALTIFAALKRIVAVSHDDDSVLFESRASKTGKTGVLLISSDKGLAGSINTNLFKKVQTFIGENALSKEDLYFIVVGKKARDFVQKKDYTLGHYFEEIGDSSDMPMLGEVSRMITDLYKKGECKAFYSAYTMFVTTTEQHAAIKRLLPISVSEIKSFIKESVPETGKYSDADKIAIDKDPSGYTFEPSSEKILQNLLPYALNVSVYYSLLEAKASEHSARMVAMKNATDKAGDVAKLLRRQFNKQRQADITAEISEITAGMETSR